MLYNIWKSTLSGATYELPADWLPAPGMMGWELIGTIRKG